LTQAEKPLALSGGFSFIDLAALPRNPPFGGVEFPHGGDALSLSGEYPERDLRPGVKFNLIGFSRTQDLTFI
jgi:hypothetical protein